MAELKLERCEATTLHWPSRCFICIIWEIKWENIPSWSGKGSSWESTKHSIFSLRQNVSLLAEKVKKEPTITWSFSLSECQKVGIAWETLFLLSPITLVKYVSNTIFWSPENLGDTWGYNLRGKTRSRAYDLEIFTLSSKERFYLQIFRFQSLM